MTVTAKKINGNKGLLGYRLTNSTSWTVGSGNNDWSGCYIGTTIEQAKGYVEIQSGVIRVWKCNLVATYPFWCIHGEEMVNPSISSDEKAKLVIEAIKVAGQNVSSPLIPSLCQANQGYIGPDTTEYNEIILGWNCLNAIHYNALRDYNIKNYEYSGWSQPGASNWQPMNTEPTEPKSPLFC